MAFFISTRRMPPACSGRKGADCPPPMKAALMSVAVGDALKILRDEPERRQRLHDLITLAGNTIRAQGWTPSGSQIIPYIVGHNERTMTLAAALQRRGFDIRGIRPPTVPPGTARLRISLTLNVTGEDFESMLASLQVEAQTLTT